LFPHLGGQGLFPRVIKESRKGSRNLPEGKERRFQLEGCFLGRRSGLDTTRKAPEKARRGFCQKQKNKKRKRVGPSQSSKRVRLTEKKRRKKGQPLVGEGGRNRRGNRKEKKK